MSAGSVRARGKRNQSEVPRLDLKSEIATTDALPTQEIFRGDQDATVVPRATASSTGKTVERVLRRSKRPIMSLQGIGGQEGESLRQVSRSGSNSRPNGQKIGINGGKISQGSQLRASKFHAFARIDQLDETERTSAVGSGRTRHGSPRTDDGKPTFLKSCVLCRSKLMKRSPLFQRRTNDGLRKWSFKGIERRRLFAHCCVHDEVRIVNVVAMNEPAPTRDGFDNEFKQKQSSLLITFRVVERLKTTPIRKKKVRLQRRHGRNERFQFSVSGGWRWGRHAR